MAIVFNCQRCGKKVEAPDNAAGKNAKCPSCHNKVTIPDANAADDELRLAPIDEADETRRKQLMTETFRLEQDILSQKEVPDKSSGAGEDSSRQPSEKELTAKVVLYLRQMADGQLDKAQQTETLIVRNGSAATAILDQIAVSEIGEPKLADIPPQVLSGLIRRLRSKIS
jgi:DNA-directed RNA polymerase subunit RPC12/RpoP